MQVEGEQSFEHGRQALKHSFIYSCLEKELPRLLAITQCFDSYNYEPSSRDDPLPVSESLKGKFSFLSVSWTSILPVTQVLAPKSHLVPVITVQPVGGQSYIQWLLTVDIVLKVHGKLDLIICHNMIRFVKFLLPESGKTAEK